MPVGGPSSVRINLNNCLPFLHGSVPFVHLLPIYFDFDFTSGETSEFLIKYKQTRLARDIPYVGACSAVLVHSLTASHSNRFSSSFLGHFAVAGLPFVRRI